MLNTGSDAQKLHPIYDKIARYIMDLIEILKEGISTTI